MRADGSETKSRYSQVSHYSHNVQQFSVDQKLWQITTNHSLSFRMKLKSV